MAKCFGPSCNQTARLPKPNDPEIPFAFRHIKLRFCSQRCGYHYGIMSVGSETYWCPKCKAWVEDCDHD